MINSYFDGVSSESKQPVPVHELFAHFFSTVFRSIAIPVFLMALLFGYSTQPIETLLIDAGLVVASISAACAVITVAILVFAPRAFR